MLTLSKCIVCFSKKQKKRKEGKEREDSFSFLQLKEQQSLFLELFIKG
jgi:hypothetical protein